MLRELYTNPQPTTLATTVNSSITTVVLTDASTFPTNNFRILIESEIMFCTSRSSNTLTVIRGQEGTTGASHSSGVAANHIITAGALDTLREDLYAFMGFGRKPSTGNTYGDEFDDENFSGWTAVDSGSAPQFTVIEQDHWLSLYHPGGGASGQFLSYMKSVGSRTAGDWISMCYRHHECNTGGFPQATLWFADGMTYGAGNQCGYAYSPHEATTTIRGNTNFNNQTSFNGGEGTIAAQITVAWDMHLKLVYKGSNQWDAYHSADGITWLQTNSNTGVTCTPTHVGFGFTTWGGTKPASISLRNFRTSF